MPADHSVAGVQGHCAKCHGKNGKTGVNLLGFKSTSDLTGDIDLLQDIIDVIDTGDMPPEDEPGLNRTSGVCCCGVAIC